MADHEPAHDAKTYYAVVYFPGPNWDPAKSADQQGQPEHVAYQAENYQRGVLVAGGPYRSGDTDHFGLALFSADSLDTVRAIVAEDPAVKSGTYAVTVHEWLTPINALAG